MKTIKLFPIVGNFAENKDLARELRINEIVPTLEEGNTIILDFENINSATQSFIHALISDIIRQHGPEILDRLTFAHVNETVRKIIEIVVDYMQD